MTNVDATGPSSPPASTPAGMGPLEILVVGLTLLGIGLWVQWGGVVATLTCQRNATKAVSCVVERRSSFNAVTVARESVAGIQGARIVEWSKKNSPSFIIMLDTTDGERRMDVSSSRDAAEAVVRSINEGIRTAEGRFEVVNRPVGWDWLAVVISLVSTVVGVAVAGVAVAALVLQQRSSAVASESTGP